MPGPARRQFPSIDPQPRTTTTHNGPGQRNKHSGRSRRQQQRRQRRRQQRQTGSAATEAERDKTDQRAKQKHKQAETQKAKDTANQSTTRRETAAPLSSGPRPTPPSACLTHDARKGIGRGPDGSPAICSHGPPEVRVGFWTAPQTILRGERGGAQVAVKKTGPVERGEGRQKGRDIVIVGRPTLTANRA
jgi:hypothetical protein